MTGWFWFALILIIIGLGLSWYAAIKALNTAFSPKEDHGLFWGGTVCLTAGIVILMVIFFSYVNENTKLNKKVDMLNRELGQCKGISGSSGPGLWSRFKGLFSRNTSVPAAGNPGEVNPFKKQEQSS